MFDVISRIILLTTKIKIYHIDFFFSEINGIVLNHLFMVAQLWLPYIPHGKLHIEEISRRSK